MPARRHGGPAAILERPVTHLCFAGLVALAWGLNPIPFRTRPLNPSAPMVLSLKAWESRSLPGLPSTDARRHTNSSLGSHAVFRRYRRGQRCSEQVAEAGNSDVSFSDFRRLEIAAGWSSPVARQAHNLKVIGSNPIPATKLSPLDQPLRRSLAGFFIANDSSQVSPRIPNIFQCVRIIPASVTICCRKLHVTWMAHEIALLFSSNFPFCYKV